MKSKHFNKLAILSGQKQFFGQTFTLIDLMKELDASNLISILHHLNKRIDFLAKKPDTSVLTNKEKEAFDHLFNVCIRNTFQFLGWFGAHASASTAAGWLFEAGKHGKKVTTQVVLSELYNLQSEINMSLSSRIFVIIDPDKTKFVLKNFGENVAIAFPSAKDEINNAGKCLALDLNTAAVFHLMRTVEIGLRALAIHLKVKTSKPLNQCTWGQIIAPIESKLKLWRDNTGKKSKLTQKKREAITFYRILSDEIFKFKEIWRNNTMHTNAVYTETEAKAVFENVRDFMQRLSTKVSE